MRHDIPLPALCRNRSRCRFGGELRGADLLVPARSGCRGDRGMGTGTAGGDPGAQASAQHLRHAAGAAARRVGPQADVPQRELPARQRGLSGRLSGRRFAGLCVPSAARLGPFSARRKHALPDFHSPSRRFRRTQLLDRRPRLPLRPFFSAPFSRAGALRHSGRSADAVYPRLFSEGGIPRGRRNRIRAVRRRPGRLCRASAAERLEPDGGGRMGRYRSDQSRRRECGGLRGGGGCRLCLVRCVPGRDPVKPPDVRPRRAPSRLRVEALRAHRARCGRQPQRR